MCLSPPCDFTALLLLARAAVHLLAAPLPSVCGADIHTSGFLLSSPFPKIFDPLQTRVMPSSISFPPCHLCSVARKNSRSFPAEKRSGSSAFTCKTQLFHKQLFFFVKLYIEKGLQCVAQILVHGRLYTPFVLTIVLDAARMARRLFQTPGLQRAPIFCPALAEHVGSRLARRRNVAKGRKLLLEARQEGNPSPPFSAHLRLIARLS